MLELNAQPIPAELGTGEWSYTSSNGGTGSFADATLPNTVFYGQAEKEYTLTWSVTSQANPACTVSKDLQVVFPEDCSKLNFDGDDDYIDLGDNYDMGQNSFSVEAWVKPHSTDGVKTILSKRIAW